MPLNLIILDSVPHYTMLYHPGDRERMLAMDRVRLKTYATGETQTGLQILKTSKE
jgi:hypothetical protein